MTLYVVSLTFRIKNDTLALYNNTITSIVSYRRFDDKRGCQLIVFTNFKLLCTFINKSPLFTTHVCVCIL